MTPAMLPERVATKIQTDSNGCWVWTAGRNQFGYGRVKANGRLQVAHRVVYETLVGPIPEGLELDHLCNFKPCVNPQHLEPVTRSVNIRRANALRLSCKHGHPRTPENGYRLRTGTVICLPCKRQHGLDYYYRRKAVAS